MDKELFCIPLGTKDEKHVATKAYNDVQSIVDSFATKHLCGTVYPTEVLQELSKKRKTIAEIKKNLEGKEGSYVFIQYPTYLGDTFLFPEGFASFSKKYRCVYFIHDLNGIRYGTPWVNASDKKVLKNAWRILSLNEKMTVYLVRKFGIPEEKILSYGFWDYLVPKTNRNKRTKGNGLVFAGNLTKSVRLIEDYQKRNLRPVLNLYGYLGNRDWFKKSDNVFYRGSFKGDEVQDHLDGSFGLVWDGTSATDLKGPVGTYQEYNCPHKAGLYVVSGLPLIVSKKAAIYPFVKERGIGFGVDSLEEAEGLISSLSEEEYSALQERVFELGDSLRKGERLKGLISLTVKDYREGQ